jgi:CBS-domain-containing membrane protein
MRTVKVEDVMTRRVVTAGAEEPLKLAARLMHRSNVSALPVVGEDGRLRGIVSEADLLRVGGESRESHLEWILRSGSFVEAERVAEGLTVGDAMTRDAVTVHPEISTREAARILLEAGVKRLPVVDRDGVVVGIVSRHDLLMPMIRNDEEIRREIDEAVRWVGVAREVSVDVEDGTVTLRGEVSRRSERDMLAALVGRIDGVLELRDLLRFREDDGDRGREAMVPAPEAMPVPPEC